MKTSLFSKKAARLAFVALAFLASKSGLLAQPFPLEITTTINPPPVTRVDQILDNPSQIVMDIVNSGAARDIYFLITLDGISGDATGVLATISGNFSDVRIPLSEGFTRWMSADIRPFYASLDAGDYVYSFAEPQQEAMLRDGYLPSGVYRICLQAFDADTDLAISSEMGPNCAELIVPAFDPPVLRSPNDQGEGVFVASNDANNIDFLWDHTSVYGLTDVEYTLEIRRIPTAAAAQDFQETGRPHDVFETFPMVGVIEDLPYPTSSHSTAMDDLPLVDGEIYVARVVARSSTVLFYNQGRSNTVILFYGGGGSADGCVSPDLTVEWRFPMEGDTVPFRYFPTLVAFEPVCDNMRGFDSRLNLNNLSGGASAGPAERDLDWPDGPYNWLENFITAHGGNPSDFLATREDAGYINLLPQSAAGDPAFSLRRGEQYGLTNSMRMRYRDLSGGGSSGTLEYLTVSLPPTRVTVGMTRSGLNAPENGATVAGPTVDLAFKTGEAPNVVLPEFSVYTIESGRVREHWLTVQERLVVQVSTDATFSNIIFRKQKRIQSEANDPSAHPNEDGWAFEAPSSRVVTGASPRSYDENAFVAAVYKDETVTTPALAAGRYFWRIGWLRQPERFTSQGQIDATTNADFYLFSPVRDFIIDPEADGELVEGCGDTDVSGWTTGGGSAPAPPPSDCERACNVNISGFSAAPLTELLTGQTVRVGTFDVRILEVTERGGDGRFSGRGAAVVKVDPAAAINLNLNFEFSNARFNAERQMLTGEMRAVRDDYGSTTRWIERNIDGIARSIPSFPSGADANLAFSAISNITRLLTATNSAPTNLPFGIDLSDGQDFRIVASLDNLVLGPTGARGRYLLGVKLPESLAPDMPSLMFGADQVCFSPDGPRGESRYFLAENIEFGDPTGWQVTIRGAMPTAASGGSATALANARGTFIEFDCAGFKSLQFQGSVRFHRDALVPETAAGVRTTGTERVEATISTRINKDAKFILGLNFEQPFQFTAVPDFGMTVRTAYLDFSESQNPPEMNFPSTYDFSFLAAGAGTTAPAARLLNAWTGFYLAELSFRFPTQFSSADRQRIEVGIRDFMIDPSGVSGAISVGPIFSEGTPGRVGDWAFTIDEFRIGIVQSARGYASMTGKIGLPIFRAGDYLRYGATLGVSETGSFGFDLTVRPDPTGVVIPAWEIATITLAPTTFVRIRIGAATDFSFSLTGSVSFEGSTGSGVGLAFPRIDVEGLRFSTSDSQIRGRILMGGEALWAQASPQRSMSGMPINLEGIEIAAVGGLNRFDLRFALRLELGENIAVEANPGFRFNLGTTGGPDFQRFTAEEFLMPDRMCLEATDLGGMSLAGCIRHCRSGGTERFVGELRIGIPSLATIELYADFGNYKNPTRPEAEFNTADNFNFFAFEGSVRLDQGITLFSGVALYGLGGGVYYNMQQTGASIAIPAAPTASTGAAGEAPSAVTLPTVGCSGGRYTPRYGPNVGFMFSVYLGDNAGGEAYNFDITISAELGLRRDGSVVGFNRVTFCGTLSVFSSIGASSSGAALTACVLIQYTKNDGYEGIDGLIGVSLNLGPLHGCGAGGKMVDAAFHSDNTGMWYFHMGRPPSGTGSPCGGTGASAGGAGGASPCGSCRLTDGRAQATGPAGLQINLGIINVEIATYFMVGKMIPDLPPLPAAIEGLFASDPRNRPEGGTINAGETDSRRERAPAFADTGMETGDGFAHGLYMHVGMNLNFIIFYASLDMWMGYDINVRQYTTVCSGDPTAAGMPTSHRIGMDGWFAKGQAYVGLRGEFGLGVDLPFCQAKIPILQAQAVVALRAEFPNPEWFSGRAAMSYSILNGSITGRCDFQFEVGQRCINPNYDPLEGFEFITDLKPEGAGASVFSKAAASFSMRMGQPFEVRDERTATRDNPLGTMKSFRPEFQRIVVEKVSDGTTALYDPARLTDGNYAVEAIPQVWLNGSTGYRVTAEVVVYERLANGTWRLFRKPNGDVWTDSKTKNFTTAARPQTVPPEQVRRSWPLHNQRFFLAGESMRIASGDEFCAPHQKGWLDLRTAMPELFNRTSNGLMGTQERTYTYEARILPMRGGPVLHRAPIEMTSGGRSVAWNMPNSLPPSRLFCIQLVRVPHNPFGVLPGAVALDVGFTDGGSMVNRAKVLTLNNLIAGNSSNAQLNERRLTGERAADGAFVIYNFYFKTSRYQTMQEKLAATSVARSVLGGGGSNADIFLQSPEGFERYDYHGLWRGDVQEVAPLVRFNHLFGTISAPAGGATHLITDGTERVKTDLFDFMNNLPHMNFRHDFTGFSTLSGLIIKPSATVFNDLCTGSNCRVASWSGQIIRARYRSWSGFVPAISGLTICDFEEPLSRDEIEGSDAPPGAPRAAVASADLTALVLRSGSFTLGGGSYPAVQAVINTAPSGNIRLNNNLPAWWEFARSGADDHILRIENRIARAISPSVADGNLFNTENYGNVWSKMQYVAHPAQPLSLSSGTRYRMAATYWCPTPFGDQCRTTSTRNFDYTPR